MVEGVMGMEGVIGDELHGGRWLREFWGFGLRWLSIALEVMGGSARVRGEGWWHWLDWRGSARGKSD